MNDRVRSASYLGVRPRRAAPGRDGMYVGRAIQRGRIVAGERRRLVTTIESTALAQNVAVHVVRSADKYYLVGGGSAGVALLAELPREEIEPYIEAQRAALLEAQRAALDAPLRPLQEIMTRRRLPWILAGLAADRSSSLRRAGAGVRADDPRPDRRRRFRFRASTSASRRRPSRPTSPSRCRSCCC